MRPAIFCSAGMAFALSAALAMPTDGAWAPPGAICGDNESFDLHGLRKIGGDIYCDLTPFFRRDSLFVVNTDCRHAFNEYGYDRVEVWEIENRDSIRITYSDSGQAERYVRCARP
jgi:hypothetical protein